MTLLSLALLHVSFELQTSVALLIATILFHSACSVLFMVLAHFVIVMHVSVGKTSTSARFHKAAQNPQAFNECVTRSVAMDKGNLSPTLWSVIAVGDPPFKLYTVFYPQFSPQMLRTWFVWFFSAHSDTISRLFFACCLSFLWVKLWTF